LTIQMSGRLGYDRTFENVIQGSLIVLVLLALLALAFAPEDRGGGSARVKQATPASQTSAPANLSKQLPRNRN
jgi:hypothetical protein